MPVKYSSLPTLTEGLTPWQRMFLDGVKDNLELLTRQKGDGTLAAIQRGVVTVITRDPGVGVNLYAAGPWGYVPTLSEFNSLVSVVNLLITNLRS